MRLKIILIFIGLAMGNFLYSYMTNQPSFDDALERTYFQFIALGVTLIITPKG